MSFFSTKEKAFGLDISDQTLRLAQFSQVGKKPRLQIYNEIKLPAGCLVKGEIKQPTVFISHLQKLVKTKTGHGKLSKEAVISLPESETFLKTLNVEITDEAKIIDIISEILPQTLPLSMEEIYWDYQIVNKEGTNWQLVIGASPKSMVDAYLKIFADAGIIPVVLEIEAIAISNLLIDINNNHVPQIVIDIGQNRTGLFLYDGDVIQFTVSLNISGDLINETISQSLDLNAEQAEEAKIICGLDATKCQGAVLELITPTIEDLARQILNAVNFYYENFANPKEIKNIIVCGGGANMIDLAKVIQQATDINTSVSQPFAVITNPNPHFFTPTKSQSFITTMGLGLRGLKSSTFYDRA
jgi:type IV pilus assembly protein PilM